MKKNKEVLFAIGHTQDSDKGSYSEFLKQSEWDYNRDIANGLNADVYVHTIRDYYQRQRALAKFLRENKQYKLVIELHFNGHHTQQANGFEVFAYSGSNKGERYARELADAYIKEYPEMKIRGARGVKFTSHKSERGFYFLNLTPIPALILEPFFGTNKQDCDIFKDKERYICFLNNFINDKRFR